MPLPVYSAGIRLPPLSDDEEARKIWKQAVFCGRARSCFRMRWRSGDIGACRPCDACVHQRKACAEGSTAAGAQGKMLHGPHVFEGEAQHGERPGLFREEEENPASSLRKLGFVHRNGSGEHENVSHTPVIRLRRACLIRDASRTERVLREQVGTVMKERSFRVCARFLWKGWKNR